MQKGTVLSIEDDEHLQLVIGQYLTGDGYNVLQATHAKDAIEKIDHSDIDVVLLDLMLPDEEGLTVLKAIKEKTSSAIIVVSGKTDTMEKVICLEMGADDYLAKPFEMRELCARIKAVSRRFDVSNDREERMTSTSKAEKLKFGDGWTLDRPRYQLFDKNDQSAELTTGQFKLLEALLSAPNKTLSRERLFEITRDGEFEAYDRAIDIQIARLRSKIHDNTKPPELIKTVRGVGYMFCGKVRAQ